MESVGGVPVVRCGGDVLSRSAQILAAIRSVGFVYLIDFGITLAQVEAAVESADAFWKLPSETKQRYARLNSYETTGNTGYVGPGVEKLDTKNLTEIREAYNINPWAGKPMVFPDDVLPNFRMTQMDFFDSCHDLSKQILLCLSAGLNLEEANVFEKSHENMGIGANATTLRLLHYPPLLQTIAPGTQRCGEHSDYGTITLLFQDSIGGLEVRARDGSWMPVEPLPDAVLLNTGDLLEIWTNGGIPAVKHRVLVPEQRSRWQEERRSMAFFEDDDFLVRPLIGESPKYDPVTSKQHLINMFAKTY